MSGSTKRIAEVLDFVVDQEAQGKRLDIFLTEAYGEFSRSYVQKLIEDGFVLVDDKEIKKPSRRLKAGQKITFYIPQVEPLEVLPEDIPFDVVYEDEDILVLIKPCGLVVHPSPGYSSGTLVNALLFRIKELSGIGGKERPGIVHRLDKNTAGLMVVAKSDKAHRSLVEEFMQRRVLKRYHALVSGILREDSGTVEKPIGRHPVDRKKFSVAEDGKPAKTEYEVIKRFEKHRITFLDVRIHTGRTHQIRVHLSFIGHPVLGDKTYGFKTSSVDGKILNLMGECHMLVSYQLGFYHPITKKWMDFQIEDPKPFRDVLNFLEDAEKQTS
ncbi:MAG: RluA family pseudouridine synthase [Hydrogenobacter thermophilus]|uniref:RluA family pseudouridine synthase n=1 Tax=Hydrogenobacter thermophilus TaxID=940 RepID=UPI001C746002|nr:RluA family pseudouridine synthase [Hydrogenobacter thermophilus]QWK19915.1 MAG: RluA family pseudouridine synthase [Hydrogenobacter thermophilus]